MVAKKPNKSILNATVEKDETVKLCLINAHINIVIIPIVEFSLPKRLLDITSTNIPVNTLGIKSKALLKKAFKISICFLQKISIEILEYILIFIIFILKTIL